MRRLVAVVLALALFGPAAARAATGPAAPPSLAALAAQLGDAGQQKAAIEALGNLADPAVPGLLRALKDGALYAIRGRVAVLDDDGTLKDATGQPLRDAGGPVALADGQDPIAVEDGNFGAIQRILERFDVTSPNPATRKSAAMRLADAREPAALPLLTRALALEKQRDVRAVMEEAVARLELAAPDPALRLHAVRYLGRLGSEIALAQLQAMRASETDAQVRAAVADSIRRVEQHVELRNIVGYVFNGISLSAVLLIMSLGLAVTFGLMGIINMAHGEMLMIGSYTAYVVQNAFAAHWPAHQDQYFFVAMPLAFLAASLVGLVLETTILRFLYGRPLETLIVTWGIGMMLQQGARLAFGDQTSVNPPTFFRGGVEVLPGLVFPWSRIFIVALAVAALAALTLLLRRSYGGLRVRAVMQNRAMAACLGVSTRRIDAITFALGTAMAGVAGCALALIGTVDPEVGKTYIVDSFMVVVLGGVGKLAGTVVASLAIGLSNKLLEPAIGGTAAAVYAKVVVLGILIWFLQWRPKGLFAPRGRAAAEAEATT